MLWIYYVIYLITKPAAIYTQYMFAAYSYACKPVFSFKWLLVALLLCLTSPINIFAWCLCMLFRAAHVAITFDDDIKDC